MATRTQITLRPDLQRRARERAAQLGVSLAEYIRRVVARDLGESDHKVDATVVFNLGSSDGSHVARDKDAMIGATVATERRSVR